MNGVPTRIYLVALLDTTTPIPFVRRVTLSAGPAGSMTMAVGREHWVPLTEFAFRDAEDFRDATLRALEILETNVSPFTWALPYLRFEIYPADGKYTVVTRAQSAVRAVLKGLGENLLPVSFNAETLRGERS